MSVARDAWMFFLPLLGLAGGLYFAEQKPAAGIVFSLALFVLFFFRDPYRKITNEPNAVVSPADGVVVKIDRDWFDDTTNEKRIRISIFLSIFNVHINRYPISGKVIKKEMIDGKFLAAFNHMASEENSRSVITINSAYGKVTVKQIVGLIARRIVCNTLEGDEAVKGERYGLIRFGSRMDVTLPATATVDVKLKDKVHGGSSIIAHMKD